MSLEGVAVDLGHVADDTTMEGVGEVAAWSDAIFTATGWYVASLGVEATLPPGPAMAAKIAALACLIIKKRREKDKRAIGSDVTTTVKRRMPKAKEPSAHM